MHLAAYKGHEKVVGALLDHVQKKLINKLSEIVNAKTNDNWTPLHLATIENYSDVVRILLSSGAIYNAKTEQEKTPLHLAQENSEIHRLLSNIENLFTSFKTGNNIGKNEVESINELLQSKGADIIKAIVNAQDNYGGSLHYAAWKGYIEITVDYYSLKNIEISTIEKGIETPIENLISKLDKRDPSNWQSEIDGIKSLNNYESFTENYKKFINFRDEKSFRNLLSSLRVENQKLKESEKQLLNDIFNKLNKLDLDNIVDAFKEELFKKFEEFVENCDIKLGKAFKVISQLFNDLLSSVDKDKKFSEIDRKLVENFLIYGKLLEDIIST